MNNLMDINKHCIRRLTTLDTTKIDIAFNIIKNNMMDMGYNVSTNDKKLWFTSLNNNLQNKDYHFYLIYKNEIIIGFLASIIDNGRLTISEIQLDNKNKHTWVIIYIIKYILNAPEYAKVYELFFNINKNNIMSNKTFSHLGGIIVEERQKSYLYKIKRNDVQNYLKSLLKY